MCAGQRQRLFVFFFGQKSFQPPEARQRRRKLAARSRVAKGDFPGRRDGFRWSDNVELGGERGPQLGE